MKMKNISISQSNKGFGTLGGLSVKIIGNYWEVNIDDYTLVNENTNSSNI